jgi:60 kDa SS-A/Ro ribonucleoprotein
MANTTLFQTTPGRLVPAATAKNEAGGTAYALTAEEALAQYAATGTFNGTFYASAEEQLSTVLGLLDKCASEYIARVAIYARERGHMKDLPAFLVAYLVAKGRPEGAAVFDRVIDNGRMVRNFVQFIRSGVFGRKSLGTAPKRLVRRWLAARSDDAIFRASVGTKPSLADIVKMVHPKPSSPERQALYRHLIGSELTEEHKAALPKLVQEFEGYKAALKATESYKTIAVAPPAVPFEMLTALTLTQKDWQAIALNAGWQWLRMNLNTLARHGCFDDHEFVKTVAARLADPAAVAQARVFPYQLLMAYLNASDVPTAITNALQDALEQSLANVPEIPGMTYVCLDVSGSMGSAITGVRKGATSKARCIDVAALVAAALVRKNPSGTSVIPFEGDVVHPSRFRMNPRDSVMTNAKLLASLGGGSTNCSAPLRVLNAANAKGDLVVYVSDNESWVDAAEPAGRYVVMSKGTATMTEWRRFQARNPNAKMVNINIQPYGTTQASNDPSIINVGGFSDAVFSLLGGFASGTAKSWVDEINAVTL